MKIFIIEKHESEQYKSQLRVFSIGKFLDKRRKSTNDHNVKID